MFVRKVDHPRVCGEKIRRPIGLFHQDGSPPRVRGKDYNQSPGYAGSRITPACAGKSAWRHIGTPDRRDHPRVCGEKARAVRQAHPLPGSPPRVRGKDYLYERRNGLGRITPACAGKSWMDV